MKSKLLLTTVMLSIAISGLCFEAAIAKVTDLQKATALVKPSAVYIKTSFTAAVAYVAGNDSTLYGPYQMGGTGSGFFINPDGFLITNAHVVEPNANLLDMLKNAFISDMVQQAEKKAGRPFSEGERSKLVSNLVAQGQIYVCKQDGSPILKSEDVPREVVVRVKAGISGAEELYREFPAEVRAISPMAQKDIAILKISERNLPTAPLGDSDSVQLQDEIFVLGYPGAIQSTFEESGAFGGDSHMEVTITRGIISSFKTWNDGSPILGTDASTTHGNSGGPAINAKGEVIGVLSMGALTQYSQAFGFNFLRPINVAKDFVRAAGVEIKVSLTDTRYREALEHFWTAEEHEEQGKFSAARKEYEIAKTTLRSVLDLYNQHPDATRYIVKAEEAISRLPKGLFSSNWLRYLLIAGAALVLLAIVAAIALRKPATQKAATTTTPQRSAAKPAVATGQKRVLIAQSGPLQGNRFEIGPEGLLIGRDPGTCQVVYNAETVSRQHAKITVGPEGATIQNLSTTNPTYLNDQPVSQRVLHNQDRIRIGQVVFLYQEL